MHDAQVQKLHFAYKASPKHKPRKYNIDSAVDGGANGALNSFHFDEFTFTGEIMGIGRKGRCKRQTGTDRHTHKQFGSFDWL